MAVLLGRPLELKTHWAPKSAGKRLHLQAVSQANSPAAGTSLEPPLQMYKCEVVGPAKTSRAGWFGGLLDSFESTVLSRSSTAMELVMF